MTALTGVLRRRGMEEGSGRRDDDRSTGRRERRYDDELGRRTGRRPMGFTSGVTAIYLRGRIHQGPRNDAGTA